MRVLVAVVLPVCHSEAISMMDNVIMTSPAEASARAARQ